MEQKDRNYEYRSSLEELSRKHRGIYTPRCVSLFSGCGGLCYGIRAAGFNIVAASELMFNYRYVHRLNNPSTMYLDPDVRDINTHIDDIDLLIGGPPCQGFSSIGNRNPDDDRNNLVYQYIRLVDLWKPKVCLIENVPGLLEMRKANPIVDRLVELGYEVSFSQLNAKDYGVPQSRKRVFFIASRVSKPSFPATTHSNPYTLWDAISDLEPLENGEHSLGDPWHRAYKHSESVICLYKDIKQGESASYAKTQFSRGHRMVADKPSITITTVFRNIHNGVHPFNTRALTIREGTRIQSFPDSFIWKGNITDICKMIGNSVPPILAYNLGKHILRKILCM